MDDPVTSRLSHMSVPAMATSGLIHALIALALVQQWPPTERVLATQQAIEFTVDLVSPPPSPVAGEQQAPPEAPVADEPSLPSTLPLPDGKPLAELIPPASEPRPDAPSDFPPPPSAPPPGQTLKQSLPPVEQPPVVSTRELARNPAVPALPKTPPPRARPVTPAPVTTVAAKPAVAESQRRAEQDYFLQVIQKLSRYRYYPKSHEASENGMVVTRVTVARDGRLLDVELTKSSGFPNLDRGVMETIRQASPFAPLPAEVTDSQLIFTVPISYTRER
jgi:periplasmic protein TonB